MEHDSPGKISLGGSHREKGRERIGIGTRVFHIGIFGELMEHEIGNGTVKCLVVVIVAVVHVVVVVVLILVVVVVVVSIAIVVDIFRQESQ